MSSSAFKTLSSIIHDTPLKKKKKKKKQKQKKKKKKKLTQIWEENYLAWLSNSFISWNIPQINWLR